MQQKRYFKDILKKLSEMGLPYVILRDDNFFKSKDNTAEFDILILGKDLKKIKTLFKKIPNTRVFKNNIDLTHPFLVRTMKDNFIVDFDFQVGGISYCGSPVLKEAFLFKNKKKVGGLTYLNAKAEFLMLLVHGFVFKKKFKYFSKYTRHFSELYKKVGAVCVKGEMSRMFGKKLSEEIILNLENKNLEAIFKMQRRLRNYHLFKNPLRIFAIAVSKLMRIRNYFKIDRFFYFINPFKWAPLISFIGSDGSGKSTLSGKTRSRLDSFDIPNKEISLGAFSSIKNPFKRKTKGTTYSKRIILSYENKNSLELLARILMQIPGQIKVLCYRKRGIAIISDRYSYDLVNFYGARGILKSLVKIISQKPTKCFYVKVSPKKLIERSDDLSLDAATRVVSTIERNKKFFLLIDLKNENFKNTEKELNAHLSEIIKNV